MSPTELCNFCDTRCPQPQASGREPCCHQHKPTVEASYTLTRVCGRVYITYFVVQSGYYETVLVKKKGTTTVLGHLSLDESIFNTDLKVDVSESRKSARFSDPVTKATQHIFKLTTNPTFANSTEAFTKKKRNYN